MKSQTIKSLPKCSDEGLNDEQTELDQNRGTEITDGIQ